MQWLIVIFLFCTSTMGQFLDPHAFDSIDINVNSLWEYYGKGGSEHADARSLNKKHEDLFLDLVPYFERNKNLEFSKNSFYIHFKDSHKEFPKPELIKYENLDTTKNKLVGKITYVNFFPKPYRYDLYKENDTLVIEVRVHFRNIQPSEIQNIENELHEATNIWNKNRHYFSTNFKYAFRFLLETDKRRAHFSVKLKNKTRGPYDTYWGRKWTSQTIAHEMGHMMGLGDEYGTISGHRKCIKDSIMCLSWRGKVMRFHYYFILRRLL